MAFEENHDGDASADVEYEDAAEVAAYDRYIMDRFGHVVSNDDFYGVQLLVSMHCSGMIGDTGVDFRYGNEAQALIADIDSPKCEDVERSPIFVQSPSAGNTNWDEMIATRFARTVW